jgi:hypothetical protein
MTERKTFETIQSLCILFKEKYPNTKPPPVFLFSTLLDFGRKEGIINEKESIDISKTIISMSDDKYKELKETILKI